MPTLQYSFNGGGNWSELDGPLPLSIPSTLSDTVLVEAIGDAVTSFPLPSGVPINGRVVQIGDSNTQYGNYIEGTILVHSGTGELQQLAAMTGQFNIDVFNSVNSTSPGWQGSNAGIAGTTYSNISARLPKILQYSPHVLIIAGGTNDGCDSGPAGVTIANNYITMAQEAKNNGVPYVIIRAIPAVAGAQFNAGRHQGRLSFLSTIQTFAASNSWCKVADIYSGSIQGTGEAIAGYLQADGLHLSDLGAYMNALVYKSILDGLTNSTVNNLITNHQVGTVTPSNGFLSGNAGVLSGLTGQAPTDWTITETGTSTVTAVLEPNVQTGGQTLVLNITPAAGTGTDTVTISPTANLPTVANQWYMAWMEAELDGTFTNISLPGSSGSFTAFRSNGAYANNTPQFVRTPPAKSTGASKPTITITITRGGAQRQVRIKRVMVVPITSPYATWNVNTAPVNIVAPSASGINTNGSMVTINHGTWSPMTTGVNQESQYRIEYFRDLVSVSSWLSSSPTSTYTQTASDVGATMDFVVSAANQSEFRSATSSVRFNLNTTAPVLVTAEAPTNGSTIRLTYSEALDTASVPSIASFAITNSGGTDTPLSVVIAGAVCVITKSRTTQGSDTITLNYTPGASPIQDTVGNDAAALSARSVSVVSATEKIVRYSLLGSDITQTGNSATGFNYRSAVGGFSSNSGMISTDYIPANQDGYYTAIVPGNGFVLSLKTTASTGTWNSGIAGAYAFLNSNYVGYGTNMTTVNVIQGQANDKLRIQRVGTNILFEVQRSGQTSWITAFSWSGVTTARLFSHGYLISTATNGCTTPMGTSNLIEGILVDNFTSGIVRTMDTHTSDSGSTWLQNPITASSNVLTVGTGGTVYGTTNVAALMVSTDLPTTANYLVEGVFNIKTVIATTTAAVVGRASVVDSSFYGMLYDNGVIQLVRANDAGVRTVLGSFNYTPTLNTDFTMTVVMNGTQISGLLNGTEVIAPVTDSVITRSGRFGLRIFGGQSTESTGPHISKIEGRLL